MPRKMKSKIKNELLGEDDGEHTLTVNESFAKKFDHNKRRDELFKLQAKHPEHAERFAVRALKQEARDEGDEDPVDESSSEEEDDGYIPEETDAQIFETLLRIRSKDPTIYDPTVQLFTEVEEDEGAGAAKAKKHKVQTLRQVLANQALEHGAELPSSDDEEAEEEDEALQAGRKPKQAYDAQQEELRKAFISAADEEEDEELADGFGGVLKKRAVKEEDGSEEEVGEVEDQAGPKAKKSAKKKLVQLVDQYFDTGPPGDSEADQFLKNYILKKAWVDETEQDGYVPSYHQVVGGDGVDDEVDEVELEQAELFEHTYNFRFEEPGGATIVTHPRVVEGAVRKEDDRRKRQRDARKERQNQAVATNDEEVKRLKNSKKREIEDRLTKIARVAGVRISADDSKDQGGKDKKGKKGKGGVLRVDASLLEGDFDPEAWDRQMAAAFDDEYYADEDAEGEMFGGEAEEEGMVGPVSEDEDEGKEAATAAEATVTGFKALRKKHKVPGAPAADGSSDEEESSEAEGSSGEGMQGLDDEEGEDEEAGAGGKAARDALRAEQRAELNRLLEEYYQLDHEGTAGGIKTRFKYREVPAASYGLSIDDILRRSDKELKQVASLKKMAPYTEFQGSKQQQRPNYKALQAMHQSEPEGHHKKGAGGKWKQHGQQGRPSGPWQGSYKAAGSQAKVLPPPPVKPPAAAASAGAADGAPPPPSKQVASTTAAKQEKPASSKPADGKVTDNKQQGKGKLPPYKVAQSADVAAARAASFAPLAGSLHSRNQAQNQGGQQGTGQKRKHTGEGGEQPSDRKKQKQQGAEVKAGGEEGSATAAAHRAHKKNMKRAAKRASKPATAGVAAV